MREPITLTQEELLEITGYTQPAAQARWLLEAYQIHAKYKAGGGLSIPRALYLQQAGIQSSTGSIGTGTLNLEALND